nr:hypothetical protein [Tanacetum cinerariifolium]
MPSMFSKFVYGNAQSPLKPVHKSHTIDKDEEPSAGPDRGSKRRREGKEPESASSPNEKATRSTGKSTQGSKSRQKSASESATAEEPMQTTFEMEEPSHPEFHTGADDQPIVESSQHPEWFSQQKKPPTLDRVMQNLVELEFFLEEVYKTIADQLDWVNHEGQQYPHNLLKPLPLIPNNRGRRVIPFDHFINNDLEYLRGGASSRKYTTSVTKTKAADYGHIKDDDKLYKFKESNFKRLRIQDIEDIIVFQRRVEDLQLSVESYPKKLNRTKPDTYRSDLKRKEAYIAYSNPRGFIYQNKDKQNRLIRIDELHKFSDETLTDVRTALDDRLKGIRM